MNSSYHGGGLVTQPVGGSAMLARNGGELSGVVQRAQKLAELAGMIASKSNVADTLLGGLPPAPDGANQGLPPSATHVAAMHEALDRAERALNHASSQMDRITTALS